MAKGEIEKLLEVWNNAIQTGIPKDVVALYDANAILLPTLSNVVRHNHSEIEDYFVYFLVKAPSGKIEESNLRVFGDIAVNSGRYTFTFKDGTSAKARFTFVYHRNKDGWLIVEHHSSEMPE